MEMVRSFVILASSIICLCSCNRNTTESIDIVHESFLSIPIDSIYVHASDFYRIQYYLDEADNTEYIVFFSEGDEALYFYAIGSGKISHKISTKALQLLGRPFAFGIIDLNTVIFSTSGSSKYYIINRYENLIGGFELDNNTNSSLVFKNINSQTIDPILVNGKKVCIRQSAKFVNGFSSLKHHTNYIIEITEKLDGIAEKHDKTKSIIKFPAFPQSYISKGWKLDYEISKTLNKEHFLIQRFNDHYLEKRDFKGKIEERIELQPSRYIQFTDTFNNALNNIPPSVVSYMMKREGYWSIIHDKFRNLYYRVVLLESNHEYEEYHFAWNHVKPFTIQVFDYKYRLLNEIKFPSYKYNFSLVFPTKEGLLISLDNDFNNEQNEDSINFELFKIVN